jgi:hypothetical protein
MMNRLFSFLRRPRNLVVTGIVLLALVGVMV